MQAIMYKNTRIIGGKPYQHEGFVSSRKAAISATREMKCVNKNYSFRVLKVRDGYRIYSRRLRAY